MDKKRAMTSPDTTSDNAVAAVTASTALATDSLRFVLVDDEVQFIETFAKLLHHQGHVVHVFHSGSAALQFLAKQSYEIDILVTDYEMPYMDGLSLTQRIRSLGVKALIAVMTAFAQEDDEAKFLQAGADVVLIKPIKVAQFLAKVAERRQLGN
ncbi:response regulator [Alishewanella sp. 16-MA]|uniref:Response regulator n=1 Tax=Alishewanella maricola TaxID=2795740 RepID=A0ABS8C390_9ALTE|nr:response regulator [Alishewanella maricola]MCB5226802.1 response regulator [Alishewanella maricola]